MVLEQRSMSQGQVFLAVACLVGVIALLAICGMAIGFALFVALIVASMVILGLMGTHKLLRMFGRRGFVIDQREVSMTTTGSSFHNYSYSRSFNLSFSGALKRR